MWMSLTLYAVVASLLTVVSSDKDNIAVTTTSKVAAASGAAAESNGGNGNAASSAAAASAVSTTVIKTEHLHHKCATNEKYVSCPEKLCQPQTCDHVGIPQCPSHEENYFHEKQHTLDYDAGNSKSCSGPPACVCIDDYVRNDEGICMPAKNCPSCGNDKNATYGCGVYCGRRCSNYNEPVSCAEVCYDNSCDCKQGYVFDENHGYCVLPKDCSKGNISNTDVGKNQDNGKTPCDDCNEKGDKKKSGGGRTQNNGDGVDEKSCRGDSNAMPGCDEKCRKRCPGYEPVQCKCIENSCECKDGYVYNPATNKCVLPKQCNGTGVTTAPAEHPTTPLKQKTGTNEGAGADIPVMKSTTHKRTCSTEAGAEKISTTLGPEKTETDNTDTLIHITAGYSETTTTQSESETTESSTEVHSTTIGPKDCKGKRERYYPCALLCPQRSCTEYLNGTKCTVTGKVSVCKPECRCPPGLFKDTEGNCVTVGECRRAARQTTKSMVTSTTAYPHPKLTSTTSLMSTTPEPNCEDIGYELFVKGNHEYTSHILYDLVQTKPGNNVLCGGASILYLMAQLAMQAKGTARKELLKLLNLKETDQMCRCGGQPHLNYLLMGLFKNNIVLEQIRCLLPKISANLTATYPDIEYDLFCKIYADESCALTDDFIRSTKEVFVIGPENLDFSSSDSARNISDTVAQYTNNAFLNYIKPNTLQSLDSLILVDAEAFKGKWEKQFDSALTIMTDFRRNGKIVKVPTMNQRGLFLYAESSLLNAKILRLRYTQTEFSLTIFLPNRLDGLNDMLKRMGNPDITLPIVESLRFVDVEVYIPKFTVTAANRLKNPSLKVNIKEIFNNKSTGLEDIASCDNPYVSDILQKITFQVDELGLGDHEDIDFPKLEETLPSKSQNPRLFKADHAFCYYLCYNELALMAGVFAR